MCRNVRLISPNSNILPPPMPKKPSVQPTGIVLFHLPTLYLVNKVQLMLITLYQFLQYAIMFVLCIADSGSL